MGWIPALICLWRFGWRWAPQVAHLVEAWRLIHHPAVPATERSHLLWKLSGAWTDATKLGYSAPLALLRANLTRKIEGSSK